MAQKQNNQEDIKYLVNGMKMLIEATKGLQKDVKELKKLLQSSSNQGNMSSIVEKGAEGKAPAGLRNPKKYPLGCTWREAQHDKDMFQLQHNMSNCGNPSGQKMDLKSVVDSARKKLEPKEPKKSLGVNKLPEGQYFHMLGAKLQYTETGKGVLVQLYVDNDNVSVWMPKPFVNQLRDEDIQLLQSITPEDNWEFAYLGKDDKYNFNNIDVRKKE